MYSYSQHFLEMNNQLHAVAALVSKKELRVALRYEATWAPETFLTLCRKEKILWRKLNHGSSVVQLVAYSLYLSYPGPSTIIIKNKKILAC
jgi:hypothetical protein